MFLGERGLYFQAQKDQGSDADQPVQAVANTKPLKSVFPEEEVIVHLEKIKAERGPQAAAAEARGLMD